MASLQQPTRLTITPAKRSDRPAITRLCSRAVSSSDYVLRILPTVIDRGGLFLAWSGNELAGMTNFDPLVDGSGWLSMARTDPAWRRRGVAVSLQHYIAAYARQRRIRALRLWIVSWNKPSIGACKKGGFKQICEAAHVFRSLRSANRGKVKPSSTSSEKLQLLLKSSYAAKTQGYIGYQRHFVKLSKPLLTQLQEHGDLYLIEDSALLVTAPDKLFRILQSNLTILEGPMAKSLTRAEEIAQGMHARRLSTYIPYNPYEISVAKQHGFRRTPWGKHCLVFEKEI